MSVYPMKKFPFLRLTFAEALPPMTVKRLAPKASAVIRVFELRLDFAFISLSLTLLIERQSAAKVHPSHVYFGNFHDQEKAHRLHRDHAHNHRPARRRREHRLHIIWILRIKISP